MESDKELFTTKLRKATREIHSISDALVNAKLAFALSNNAVWTEGLLVFYEIFRFLEAAKSKPGNSVLSELFTDGMERASAFEEDLKYYLGDNWFQTYEVRESVAKYLLHLTNLEKEDPTLLIAYIYHLYMGLLSGGQILRKKRALNPFSSDTTQGNAVTDFGDKSIYTLKKNLREKTNEIAGTLNEETRQKIIEESKRVFELNNTIIGSIKGAKIIVFQKLVIVVLSFLIIATVYYRFIKQ